ncbi:RNA polymerase sigma factor [Heyndrickxia sp. NPDC080065]|uniref:RNA polymerase sigma factor n=1 Tax=Heyndrickxia sp. NPDC080065 TaxID=3390568 RepID=UPI003CFE1747
MVHQITREHAEQIFSEYSPFVFQIALLLTKSESLADDITQETFLQVFKKYHTYDRSKSMKPWIYKITLNTMRNMLRKQKWLTFISFEPESSQGNVVEKTIIKEEENEELWEEINRLSIKSKEVIVLHFYSGLKLSEVAEILDIPIGTCKSRLNTALKMLRKRLTKNGALKIRQGGNIYESN